MSENEPKIIDVYDVEELLGGNKKIMVGYFELDLSGKEKEEVPKIILPGTGAQQLQVSRTISLPEEGVRYVQITLENPDNKSRINLKGVTLDERDLTGSYENMRADGSIKIVQLKRRKVIN